MKRKNGVLLLLSLLWLITTCRGGLMSDEDSYQYGNRDELEMSLNEVSAMKIFFGHQSVGLNILQGIEDVINEKGMADFLCVMETHDPALFAEPVFAHERIGKNTDPESKIIAFKDYIEKGIGNRADIAFFKFCYVDIYMNTDIEGLFELYMTEMSLLEERYPETKFVYVTVPLIVPQGVVKTLGKKILGKELWGYKDNVQRNKFNDLLREKTAKTRRLFDLALIESTNPDGSRASYHRFGMSFYGLVPDYTSDGGHLNERGRSIVAHELILFLANLQEHD